MVGGEFIAELENSLHDDVLPFRFGVRASPRLLLIDIERCDPVHASFKDGSHPSESVHEGLIGDVFDDKPKLFRFGENPRARCGSGRRALGRGCQTFAGMMRTCGRLIESWSYANTPTQ